MTTLDNDVSTLSKQDGGGPHSLRYEQAFSTADIPPVPHFEPTETCLHPDDLFPLDVSGLSTLELHVLNSPVSRQREREYLTLEGPHSETEDRFQLLTAELDARQGVGSLRGVRV